MAPTFGLDLHWLISAESTYFDSDLYVFLVKDFRGLGVIFDIYDNDSRRNNPAIFILYNPNGTTVNYNHDNDYQGL